MHGPEHREETAFTRRFPEDREHLEKRRLKAGPRVKVVARDEKRNAFRVLHRGVCDVFRGVEEQRFAWRKPHGPDAIHRNREGTGCRHHELNEAVVAVLSDAVAKGHRVGFKRRKTRHSAPHEVKRVRVRADALLHAAGVPVDVIKPLIEKTHERREILVVCPSRVTLPGLCAEFRRASAVLCHGTLLLSIKEELISIFSALHHKPQV